MRDNHEGLPEILDAFERDGLYYGVIQVRIGGGFHAFEIGVDPGGYRALRGVLQGRPFETAPGCAYR